MNAVPHICCTFSNLKHGLVNRRTVGSVGTRRYVCTDATFDNCARAVQIEGASHDHFKDNVFNISARARVSEAGA